MRWLFAYIKNGIRQAILDGVAEGLEALDREEQPQAPVIPESIRSRLLPALPAGESEEAETNGTSKRKAK